MNYLTQSTPTTGTLDIRNITAGEIFRTTDFSGLTIVNVFSIYNGHIMSVALAFEWSPVLENERFRRWTVNVYPMYDINNNYMGYMDNGLFSDMRKEWYCVVCGFETDSFWMAVFHDIKHLLCMRKRVKGSE